MLEVTDKTFEKEVLKSKIPVFVDFWAPWCNPCKRMIPIIEKMEKEFDQKVKFVKVNVDTEITNAQTYQVMSLPTFILFSKGLAVGSAVGAVDVDKIKEIIENEI